MLLLTIKLKIEISELKKIFLGHPENHLQVYNC